MRLMKWCSKSPTNQIPGLVFLGIFSHNHSTCHFLLPLTRQTRETKGSRQGVTTEISAEEWQWKKKTKGSCCRSIVYGWFGCLVMFYIVKPHLDTTSPRGFTCLLSSVGLLIYSCSFDRPLVCCVWKVRFTVSAYDQSINWFIGTVQ